jgi:hypothetical protein
MSDGTAKDCAHESVVVTRDADSWSSVCELCGEQVASGSLKAEGTRKTMGWSDNKDDPMDGWPTRDEVKFLAVLSSMDEPTALELVEPSGLTRVSVYRALRGLFLKNLVERSPGEAGSRWRLSERGHAVVAAAREL